MGADDVVLIRQVLTGSDSDGLLTTVKMSETWNQAGRILDMQALFELSNSAHLPVRTLNGIRRQGPVFVNSC
ncbi:hypothetical protein D3C78_1919900 [compost metagenome]